MLSKFIQEEFFLERKVFTPFIAGACFSKDKCMVWVKEHQLGVKEAKIWGQRSFNWGS